jgi:hypothetical protein
MTKKLRLFCWLLFIASLVFMRARSAYANGEEKVYNIVALEFAKPAEGRAMLRQWEQTRIGEGTLLDYARTDTWVDFLFIIGYVSVLVIVSSHLRRQENRPWLRTVLQWSLPLAVLAGMLDVVENILLLINMQGDAGGAFISTRFVAGLKFFLIGMVLLIWLFVFLARWVKPKQEKTLFQS